MASVPSPVKLVGKRTSENQIRQHLLSKSENGRQNLGAPRVSQPVMVVIFEYERKKEVGREMRGKELKVKN